MTPSPCPHLDLIYTKKFTHPPLLRPLSHDPLISGCSPRYLATSAAKKYGKVVGYFVGPIRKIAIVNDFETAKQMANDENFSQRKLNYVSMYVRGNEGKPLGRYSILKEVNIGSTQ